MGCAASCGRRAWCAFRAFPVHVPLGRVVFRDQVRADGGTSAAHRGVPACVRRSAVRKQRAASSRARAERGGFDRGGVPRAVLARPAGVLRGQPRDVGARVCAAVEHVGQPRRRQQRRRRAGRVGENAGERAGDMRAVRTQVWRGVSLFAARRGVGVLGVACCAWIGAKVRFGGDARHCNAHDGRAESRFRIVRRFRDAAADLREGGAAERGVERGGRGAVRGQPGGIRAARHGRIRRGEPATVGGGARERAACSLRSARDADAVDVRRGDAGAVRGGRGQRLESKRRRGVRCHGARVESWHAGVRRHSHERAGGRG
mmetsp:Transcript_17416/g.37807  ORF Transcript_17416/g.37807 Transcript_17416/m.37807 type:complete len:317 (+) Transcript_17416:555-1505(+)